VSLPVTKVELAFTQSAGSYVYQDVTSYTRSVDISRGIQRETDTFQAGSCSVIFDNNARTFDPSYSASPLYGEIKPQASIKVTSGNQVIFVGFVDNWSFDYQIVADATATAVAYDSVSRLSKNLLPAITWTAEKTDVRVGRVLDRSEVAWSSTARQLSPGTISLGTDTVTDGTSAWDYIQQVAQSEGGAAFVAGNGDVVFKGEAAAEVPSQVVSYRTNLVLNPSFESNTSGWNGSRSASQAYTGSYSLQGTTFTQWDYLSPIAPDTYNGVKYTDTVSTWTQNLSYVFSCYVYSTLAQNATLVAGFKRTSGVSRVNSKVSTVALAANTWTRLSVVAVPSLGSMGAYLSVSVLGDPTTVFVDAVQIEASPYLGAYFDGTVKPADASPNTYTSNWNGTTNNSTSTLATTTTYSASIKNSIVLGDNGGTAIPYTDVRVVYASETLYTNVNVVTSAGTVSQSNAANGTAYGIRTLTIDPSLIQDTTNGSALANYLLDIYDNPQLRFDSITMALESLQPADQVKVLNTDIWAAASITYTPSAIGSAITAYQRIVGVNHTITPEIYHTTFNLAEFGNKFRVSSNNFGVLDTNILGY
jgi:hypothetical protein